MGTLSGPAEAFQRYDCCKNVHLAMHIHSQTKTVLACVCARERCEWQLVYDMAKQSKVVTKLFFSDSAVETQRSNYKVTVRSAIVQK